VAPRHLVVDAALDLLQKLLLVYLDNSLHVN
jgi:hypothetical protein